MPTGNGETVGVVLAGGASARMGRDKARLTIAGSTLVERAAAKLAKVCDRVLIADGGRGVSPVARSIADGPGRGPAAGILGAATSAPGSGLLVLACDLPLVPVDLLGSLAGGDERYDWIVPGSEDRLEPLCALYRPRALKALAELVEAGILGPHRLAGRAELDILRLGRRQLATFGEPSDIFANLNRPEDVEAVDPDRL